MGSPTDPNDLTVDDELLGLDAAAAGEAEPAPVYSAEDLDRLTEAERAALQEGIEPAAEPEPEPVQEAPQVQQEPPAPEPGPDVKAIADEAKSLTVQRDAVESEIALLREQYDDGEITAADFDAKLKDAMGRFGSVSAQLATKEAQVSAFQQADEQQWAAACRGFITTNPAFVAPEHRDGFDAEVNAVTADPRFASLSMQQQLELAARRYALTSQGAALTPPGAARVPEQQTQAPAPAPAAKKPAPLATAPIQTLANVPSESIDPNVSNVAALAARLDRETDPEARERIIAALPEHLLDQVLNYGG